jgi:hypothetical protein
MSHRHRVVPALLLALVLVGARAEGQSAAAVSPFTPEQQREFLAKADFVKWKDTEKGITQPLRVTLRDGDLTHDAVFQSVDVKKNVADLGRIKEINFRDYFGYNIAAHHLACLLNRCSLVPAAVERRWRSEIGSLVWWVDDVVMDEGERVKQGVEPPSAWMWRRQQQLSKLFTELTADTDRNQTNLLITSDWRLVLIDFTRAFRLHRDVGSLKTLTGIEPEVYDGLRELTRERLKAEAGRWLTDAEIDAVLARRDLLVAHVDRLVAEKGRASVVYPARPALP